jgi:hypothetical protein
VWQKNVKGQERGTAAGIFGDPCPWVSMEPGKKVVVMRRVVARLALRFFTWERRRGKRISYRHRKRPTLSPVSEELISPLMPIVIPKASWGD